MTSDTTSAAVDPYAALPARPVDPALFTDEDTYRADPAAGGAGVDAAPGRVHLAGVLRPRAGAGVRDQLGRGRVHQRGREARACVVVEVAGRSVIVTRNRDGELRAFHNVCRHRATKLLDATPARSASAADPLPVPQLDLRHRRAVPRHAAVRGLRHPAGQQADLRHVGGEGLRPGRLRPAAGRGRHRGASSSSSTSTPDPAPLAAPARRPARALRRVPARRVASPQRRQHLRRRGELQARRRELHGVLPPALGAPGAQPGLQVRRPLPLAGPRHVHRHVHHAGVAQHRRRRLGRAARP